jgi:hypothetical protein
VIRYLAKMCEEKSKYLRISSPAIFPLSLRSEIVLLGMFRFKPPSSGIRPVQLSDLGKLKAETVYVKADARVPYQQILTVLDELRGHSVVLLTSSPSNAERSGIAPPYGVKVMLGRQ